MNIANLTDSWWLLPSVILLLLLWRHKQLQKPAIIQKIVGASQWQRRFGQPFMDRLHHRNQRYYGIMLLLVIVLLRPQWDKHRQEVARKGVDILFVVDVSLSMNANDLPPSRLERAGREIKDLVHNLKGDRVGLISFAGASFLQCPLTLDYGSFNLFLNELQPGMIPSPGTDISSALMVAARAFQQEAGKSKVIVLITDGEDHADMGQKALAKLQEQQISLFVVSFGTSQGAPITDPRSGHYIKDSAGQMVISKPDFDGLAALAQAANGTLFRSTADSYGLAEAYEAIKAKLADQTMAGGVKEVYREGYMLFLALAILLMVIDALIGRFRPSSLSAKES